MILATRNADKVTEIRRILNLTASAFPAACRGVSERISDVSSLQIEDLPPLSAGSFNLPPDGLVSLLDFPEIPEIEESGLTLEDNALIKARESFRLTGLPSLADDTGLEVEALNGAPGVFSSRFAGPGASYADNMRKLLKVMNGIPEGGRRARFRCVVALKAGEREDWVEGVLDGVILTEGRGKEGFGYDPVFFIPPAGKTLAEMSLEEKNAVSHRGVAFRRMAELLAAGPV